MKVRLNKTILTDPNRFIYDGYSMWNFVELDVGIIAGSLPAVKPLFNRFLDAARGMTSKPSKSSGLEGGNASGYQKHPQQSDRQIALVSVGKAGKLPVRVSAPRPRSTDKFSWNMERAHSSEDSILVYHDTDDPPNAIAVARDVRIS